MSGAGNVGLPADSFEGVQSAVGSGRKSPDSSRSAAWSFDFTLTGPMWWEFAMASNAYGRGVRRIFLPFAVLFTVLLLIMIPKWSSNDDKGVLASMLILTVLMWLCCGGPLARWGVANKLAACVSDWFAVPSASTADIWRILGQRRNSSFDARWVTPCRLWVDDAGVVLLHRVNGEEFATRAAWSQLDCVRLTEHAVVLSPSAGGKASMDIIPAVPDVKFMDLNGCVMVDRLAVPDVDGFVRWCRKRVAEADRGARHSSHGSSSRGPGVLAVWWGRFRRWLYGDDEFLDGPPKNWLRGLGFRGGSGASV
ncbi:hypothetical protein OZX72_06805 [Bifidobacterium sp. ESL0769]|uniref:hypothetical protein n=1 Tax=Bifidobacterium sp. ESL0769 TaxID=2983229 RepID=UPI0023F771C7|nr:hypothetical protein [Bifidobacterium sp. ESL0769]WEV66956.1 hypothetical protein OZX72_06805 [Bifidobacterium sp. ESL0769]